MNNEPQFLTLLADSDQIVRYFAHVNSTDVMNAHRNGGIFLLVTVHPDGNASVAFKPGNTLHCTWSPPHWLERR